MAEKSRAAAGSSSEERAITPPRPLMFLILAASGLAAAAAGLGATGHLLWQVAVPWEAIPRGHWLALLAALALALGSLALRSLRWIFLLRRTGTYVPLRDSVVIYLAGFSLVLLPLLAGETLLRAAVARRRRATTGEVIILVNYWERALDLLALVTLTGGAVIASGARSTWSAVTLLAVAASAVPRVRWAAVTAAGTMARLVTGFVFAEPPSVTAAGTRRLVGPAAFAVGFVLSLAAWALPGLALWMLVRVWDGTVSPFQAQALFGRATLAGALTLAPGGVLIVGASLLQGLLALGMDNSAATLVVFGVRVATVGTAIALGAVLLAYHLVRRPVTSGQAHFDQIADVYDAQIPEARRLALLARKTTLMDGVLAERGRGLAGLDVGCGQGHYVARMRELGHAVVGIDESAQQVARARQLFDDPDVIRRGSILEIPFPASHFDFVYCINVLHHLDSVDVQRTAFRELGRVLKPGGALFVHEINTRNWLFRFYMGYLFPALNCIDEGVERWLLPHRLTGYTDMPLDRIDYFTFLPEFVPAAVVRRLEPVERRLERSAWGRYSAHYMAVFRKPA